MSRTEPDRFDVLLERLALPFVFAIALGVALGRQLGSTSLQTVVFSIGIGVALFLVFAWIRLRLAELPE